MTIDTGDNPPIARGKLQEAAKHLIEQGCRKIRDLKDRESLYGYVMVSRDKQAFFFACKNSPLYMPQNDPDFYDKPIISVQRQMVTIANLEQQPIILAWWGDPNWSEPMLMAYHPDEILTKWRSKTNMRAGVVMQNFPFYEGRRLYNIAILKDIWEAKKRDWKDKKKREEQKQVNLLSYLK